MTKELNDMVVFDFATMKFQQPEGHSPSSPDRSRLAMGGEGATMPEAGVSPTKVMRSPTKRAKHNTHLGESYSPKKRFASPSKTMTETDGGSKDPKEKGKDGLSSPTSISMASSFIIKNADPSFDHYYQSMKKRKAHGGLTNTYGHDGQQQTHQSKFGLITDRKPTARDGHCAVKDSHGFMYVFGGDRHLMPFNDLYMIKLQ